MTATSLVFRLIGHDEVTPATRSASTGFTMAAVAVGAAAATIAVKSLEAAMAWEAAMTRVITGAGEAKENIAADSKELMAIMGRTGVGADELGRAFYNVNSAGYHAAEALRVTEVAAQGARTGAAELGITVRALTTLLNAYKMGSDGAVDAMNVLIGTESNGKTTLEELAKAFPTVATTAALANVSIVELGGAMATMTHFGTRADVAATYLRQTIGQLSAPTRKARQAMESVGISALDVSKTLGEKGLGAALTILSNGIKSKMGPDGIVLMNTLKGAAASSTEFEKAISNMQPKQRTYIGALADMVGGVKSMQAALMLSGPYAEQFAETTADIAERVHGAKGEVEGWADAQETLKFKTDRLKSTLKAMEITLGTALIPYAKSAADAMLKLSYVVSDNADKLPIVVDAVRALGIVMITSKIISWIMSAVGAMRLFGLTSAAAATAALGPWGLLIGAVAAGLYFIWSKTTWFQDAWRAIWGKIGGPIKDVVAFVSGIDWGRVWGSITSTLSGVLGRVKKFFVDLPRTIGPALKGVGKFLGEDLADGIPKVIVALTKMLRKVIDWIVVLPVAILPVLNTAWEALKAWVVNDSPKVFGDIAKAIGPALLAFLQWLGPVLLGLIEGIVAILWGALKLLLSVVASLMGAALGLIIRAIPDAIGFVITATVAGVVLIGKALAGAWNVIKDTFTKWLPELWAWFQGWCEDVVKWFDTFDWGGFASAIWEGLKKGVASIYNALKDLASDLGRKFMEAFKSALGIDSPSKVFVEYGGHIVSGLIIGIDSSARGAVDASARLANMTKAGFDTKGGSARGYGDYEGASPSGYGRDREPPTVRLTGDREVVAFVRKLVKDRGGSVQTAFGT